MITITSLSCDLREGDWVTIPIPLSRLERFKNWVGRILGWETIKAERLFTITAIASSNQFEMAEHE